MPINDPFPPVATPDLSAYAKLTDIPTPTGNLTRSTVAEVAAIAAPTFGQSVYCSATDLTYEFRSIWISQVNGATNQTENPVVPSSIVPTDGTEGVWQPVDGVRTSDAWIACSNAFESMYRRRLRGEPISRITFEASEPRSPAIFTKYTADINWPAIVAGTATVPGQAAFNPNDGFYGAPTLHIRPVLGIRESNIAIAVYPNGTVLINNVSFPSGRPSGHIRRVRINGRPADPESWGQHQPSELFRPGIIPVHTPNYPIQDGQEVFISVAGVWGNFRNIGNRVTGDVDAAELNNYHYIGQSDVPNWAADTLYPTGFRVMHGGIERKRIATGMSGAAFDQTQWVSTIAKRAGRAAAASRGALVTLGSISVAVAATGNASMVVRSTSGTITINSLTWYDTNNSNQLINQSVTATASTYLNSGWNFTAIGQTQYALIEDITNGRSYRVTMLVQANHAQNVFWIEETT